MRFATSAEGNRVSPNVSPMPIPALTHSREESRLLSWGRSVSATVVAVVLIALGIANIATRARSNEVEDGVHWDARVEGVTAVEVASGSPGEAVGIAPGDILLAINSEPIHTRADVIAFQHQGREGTRLSYTLLRLGSQRAFDV